MAELDCCGPPFGLLEDGSGPPVGGKFKKNLIFLIKNYVFKQNGNLTFPSKLICKQKFNLFNLNQVYIFFLVLTPLNFGLQMALPIDVE